MSWRTALAIGLAVAFGLVAMSSVNRMLNPSDPEVDTVRVAATLREFRPFELLTRQSIGPREIPAGDYSATEHFLWPARTRLSTDEYRKRVDEFCDHLCGRAVLFTLAEDDLISSRKLGPPKTGPGASELVPDGLRAVSIERTTLRTPVDGLLMPGDRVDIVATRDTPSSRTTETLTILQAIPILAVDQRTDPEREVRAVTVLLSPAEVEILEAYYDENRLTLALRNPADNLLLDGERQSAVEIPGKDSQSTDKPGLQKTETDGKQLLDEAGQ